VKVYTGYYKNKQKVESVVRYALEGWILARHDLWIGPITEEKPKEVCTIVTSCCTQGYVSAVLNIRINASLEQDADRLDIVNTDCEFHDTRAFLMIRAVGEK
jgi:hypothetical protein